MDELPDLPQNDEMPKQYRSEAGWAHQQELQRRLKRQRNVRQRRQQARARTVNLARLPKYRLDELARQNPYPDGVERPVTRADCVGGARPCPFVSCRFHLYLDVTEAGNIKQNFEYGVEEMTDSCVLDIADAGGAHLEDVGVAMNLTRERVRQLEVMALDRLKRNRVLREQR